MTREYMRLQKNRWNAANRVKARSYQAEYRRRRGGLDQSQYKNVGTLIEQARIVYTWLAREVGTEPETIMQFVLALKRTNK